MTELAVACSWSGGKDSCLALHRSVRRGASPACLLTVFDESGERSRSHGLRREVVAAQAEAMGLPLLTARASWSDYEHRFIELLEKVAATGVRDVVFGDIDLVDHRAWEERVCSAVGSTAHLPLWQHDRWELLESLWTAGFVARIVAVRADCAGAEVLGATLDRELAAKFAADGHDPCGENGEFHTIVVDGPLFAGPLELEPVEVVQRGGCWVVDFAL